MRKHGKKEPLGKERKSKKVVRKHGKQEKQERKVRKERKPLGKLENGRRKPLENWIGEKMGGGSLWKTGNWVEEAPGTLAYDISPNWSRKRKR